MDLAKAYVQILPSAEGIQGSLTDLFSGEASSAGDSSGQTLGNSLFNKLKSTLVTLGIGKAITDAINQTGEFETAMTKVSTLFTGTGEEFTALEQKILDVSSQTGMAATTLAEAAYSAESASVPVELLGSMIESSAKLAVAGFTDVDTALSATAKTMNAYGDSGEDAMNRVQTVLLQTQNLGITTVGELGASLANVTPTAAAMGVSFEQIGAAMALMTSKGTATAQATTQLRSALTELGKSGTTADQSFRKAAEGSEYAGMSFKEAIAAGADLGDVFSLMNTYAETSGLSMVDLWGSVEAGNAAMMIASDIETFNSDLEAMSSTADVLGDSYGTMAESFGQSMNSLKESAKNLVTTLFEGGDISASFDALLESAGNIGEKVLTWITNGIGGIADSLPTLISGLIDFGAGLLESISNVDWIDLGTRIVNGIIDSIGTLGTKLIELFTNAVTSLTDGSVNFGEIGSKIWDGVTSVIQNTGEWLQTLFKAAVDAVGEVNFGEIGSSILGGVTSFITDTGDWLRGLFQTGADEASGVSFGEIGRSIFDTVSGILNPGGENFIGSIFRDGEDEINGIEWERLGENVAKAGAALVNLTGETLAAGFTAAETIIETIKWDKLGETVGAVANGLVSLTGEALAAAFTAAEEIINTIKWDQLGETVGEVANSLISLTGETLAGAFTAAEELINTIEWEKIGETVASVANGLVSLTGDTLAGAFTTAETIISDIKWEDLGKTVASVANGLIDITDTTLSGAFTAAHKTISEIHWDEIGTSLASIPNGMFEAVGKAGELISAPFEAAYEIISGINWSQVGADIQSGLGDVWSGITGFFGGALSGAGSALQGVGEGIGASASALGEGIATTISGWFGNDQTIEDNIEALRTAMADLKEAVSSGKEDAENAAKEVSKAIREGLESELTTDIVQQIGTDALSAMATGISDGGQTEVLKGNAKALADAIKAEFTGFDFEGVGGETVGRIADGVDAKTLELTSVTEALTEAAAGKIKVYEWEEVGKKVIGDVGSGIGADSYKFTDEMLNAADEGMNLMTSGWNSVGADIISGIISGIDSNSQTLYSTLKSLALKALNAAKSVLQIGSPSKLMRDQVGRWIPAGIAAGITSNMDVVSEAMDRVADEAASMDLQSALSDQTVQLRRTYSDEGSVVSGTFDESMTEQIAAAVREGLQGATVNSYIDGQLVTDNVSRRLGDEMNGRRFVYA